MLNHDVATSERLAALTVHALSAPDRDWLLARLTPAQATRLRGFLSELEELGIPPDPSLIDSARAVAREITNVESSKQPWESLSPVAFRTLMNEEPLQLVAVAISAFGADRQIEMLSQWPQPARGELQELIKKSAAQAATALVAAVMGSVSNALALEGQKGCKQ
jgi:hypothetical protein